MKRTVFSFKLTGILLRKFFDTVPVENDSETWVQLDAIHPRKSHLYGELYRQISRRLVLKNLRKPEKYRSGCFLTVFKTLKPCYGCSPTRRLLTSICMIVRNK